MKSFRLLSCMLFASLACSLALADDWPLFRGNPQQTGIASSELPQSLDILWKIKLKDGIEGTPAIVDGVVYVGCFDEKLYALELATGKEKWSYKAGPSKTPVSVHKGRVYLGNLDGMFHCVDAATGNKVWTYEAGAEITSGANFYNDTVLFGSQDENLYCLSLEGKERWKFRVPGGPVMGTPAITGSHTFAAGCDSKLHVIDVTNGKEVGMPLDLEGQVGASVAVDGDRLYVGTMSRQVFGIDWKKGAILWRFQSEDAREFYSSAALTKSLVILGCRDKLVYALDRNDGKKTWTFRTQKKVDSSPVVAGNRVIVGSADANLYVLDLNTGKETGRFELGHPILGSPAVAMGHLVIGTDDGTLFCIGAKRTSS